ncbi:VOC family protein [Pseudemcibacter aquimaris]|uniref:VOC family protein n=1 Tax=Pseudemcibacter aquimaris TaxID=2857064 RepID=UPI0020111367|nr:VOC family protein [Pseudemcibacter aquimaris]MCC3859968.1 VOC family protein [Pseudemcibacter aquimaris]WDU57300.1 VOC family protein [Pseudemcibacter aquimaris]
MIGYNMVGTKDLAKAGDFFDKVFGVLGINRIMDEDKFIVWGRSMEDSCFSVCLPYDQKDAKPGNGTMTAFFAENEETVKKAYEAAMANGATCEGEPGLREFGYYVAYFRDLDGNKFNVFYSAAAHA